MNEGLAINRNVQAAQSQDAEMHRGRRLFLAATMAVGSAVGAIGILESAPAGAVVGSHGHSDKATSECSPIIFNEVANNASQYNAKAALPHLPETLTSDNMQSWKDGLFEKADGSKENATNGPLANPTDRGSLAFINAVMTVPATPNTLTNTQYSPGAQFDQSMNSYVAPGGKSVAESDCKNTQDVLKSDASINEKWALSGQTVTMYTAIKNKNNEVVGMKVEKHVVNGAALGGIEIAPGKNTKNGFASMLISNNKGLSGIVFKTGFTEGTEGTFMFKPNSKNTKSSKQGQANNSGTQGNAVNNAGGGGTFGAGSGAGEADQAGNVHESGQNGGATTGTVPSFGNGGGTPSTPTETTPPPTTPPVTTPPTVPPVTTPPTTTTQPKGSEPPVTCSPYTPC